MNAFVCAGAGFLLAVLWFDLMFDVQVLRTSADVLPEQALSSIAGYYRRVTTDARPMNRLVAAAMVATIGLLIAEIAARDYAAWVGWGSLALTLAAVGLAALHTVPSAVRLGGRTDSPARQSELARSICRDHLLCIAAVAGVLAVQLAAT
ncbi:MAG TPA: hypothetical protein VFI66_07965 [Gemmatimonadales bacterium]|nr:hypothetical protein [Gemmatimonadales bacterium]